jgi:hypothetical protein
MQSLLLSNHLRERIVNCKECNLGERYCAELRARNTRLTNEYAPENVVNRIILTESPPASYKFIYDRYSKCTKNSLAHRVFVDLRYIGSDEIVNDKRKEELLQRMRTEGVLVVDCCRCAVNRLRGKRGEEMEPQTPRINSWDSLGEHVVEMRKELLTQETWRQRFRAAMWTRFAFRCLTSRKRTRTYFFIT